MPRKPPPAEQPPLHAQPHEVDAEAWAEATMQPQMKDEDYPQKTMNIFFDIGPPITLQKCDQSTYTLPHAP